MYKRVVGLFTVILAVLVGSHAEAIIRAQPSIFYQTIEIDGVEGEQTVFDLTVAYELPIMVHFGGTIEMQEFSNAKWTGFGPTVGFASNGFHADFTFFIKMDGSLGSSTLSDGSGAMFRIGYAAKIMDTIGLGPSLVFREYKFTRESGGDFEFKETAPLIDFIFTF